MNEDFSMPDWNPLVVYIDCWNFSTTHNPVEWLNKSIRAFADWFIARREIKSILLIPFNIGGFVRLDAAAKAVQDTLNFAIMSDPIYGKGNHWLTEKIMMANILELTGINYHTNWKNMLPSVLPPDVILTGAWNIRDKWADKNPSIARNKKCQEAIVFTKKGEVTTVRDMYLDSLSETEKMQYLFG